MFSVEKCRLISGTLFEFLSLLCHSWDDHYWWFDKWAIEREISPLFFPEEDTKLASSCSQKKYASRERNISLVYLKIERTRIYYWVDVNICISIKNRYDALDVLLLMKNTARRLCNRDVVRGVVRMCSRSLWIIIPSNIARKTIRGSSPSPRSRFTTYRSACGFRRACRELDYAAGVSLDEVIEEVGVGCDRRAGRNRSSGKAKNHSGKRGSRRPRRRYKDQGSMISVQWFFEFLRQIQLGLLTFAIPPHLSLPLSL